MNEQEIPIDIHIGKLQDWLVSRRIVNKNWHMYIRDIRDKISNAIQDMPASEDLVKLLSGTHINYFHCKQIVEILKGTEKDTKNIFGRYGSQRMKDWLEIIRMYEKENVYLGEAAQILVRNVNYEIPSLKKQISKFEQLGDEAEKKIQDSIKSENILRNEYSVACQQLGIKGDKIKNELTEKIKELPDLLEKAAKKIPDLKKALGLYGNFSSNEGCLPVIRHIMSAGNTTVYEFLYSEPPLSIEEPPLKFQIEVESTDNNEIDFGDDASGDGIDFGDNQDIDFGGNEAGAIDFGDDVNLETGNIDWGNEATTDSEANIDFNISLEESGIVVEESGNKGGVARGDEAFSLLDCPKYRDRVLDELFELEAFLKMRLYELSTNNKVHIISMSLLDGYTDHDAKTVTEMLSFVDVVIASISTSLIQQLFQIKHSPKYVDILASKLKQKLSAIEKLQLTQEVLKEKVQEMKQQAVSLKPTLTKIVDQTKIVQRDIEKDISKRYKNRIVNLMGNIG